MDMFNFFNANTEIAVNETYGDEWLRIRNIMQARYMRIGLELEW